MRTFKINSHNNDLMSTSHTQKRINLLQTQRLPVKSKTPLIMREFDTNEALEQYYNKLKDSNYKKRLKLQQLQESIQIFSLSSENSSSKATISEKTKEKLILSISSCENTIANELIMTNQLLLMRKRELQKIENLHEKNLKSHKIYTQLSSEHEKLINMTSNVNNLKSSAQISLNTYKKHKKSAFLTIKRKIKKKKDEVLEFQGNVEKMRAKSEEKIRNYDEKTKKKMFLKGELEKKCKDMEKILNSPVNITLKNYRRQFRMIFDKLGISGEINKNSIDFIIKTMNGFMFMDGSLSERYYQLSQIHIKKIEEFNEVIKELTCISDINTEPFKGYNLYTTYNLQRTLDDKIINEETLEKSILRIYAETYALGHRITKLLTGVRNVSSMPAKVLISYKKLLRLITNEKKKGRKTLLKAATQTSLATEPCENWMKTKLNIIDEYLKHYSNDTKTAFIIQNIVKSSPVLSFIMNSKIFQQFLIISEPLQDLSILIEDCYQFFSGQYSALIHAIIEVLQQAKNTEPDDQICNENDEFIGRRRAFQMKSCLTLGVSAVNTSDIQKKQANTNLNNHLITSNIKSLRQKMDDLRKYHLRAAKSVDVFNKYHNILNPLEKSSSFLNKK
ncbi:hypothetical protein SteCoe_25574 [Stentor coeruleus]|uniref:Uncharacterized protein n=1 Tax=Stentor coeruleus TaxID=5963 RepID=A0A1R2BEX9_9CILI|nr:hypothetical protein SteCoe_25574 [Stentor coeruleus]